MVNRTGLGVGRGKERSTHDVRVYGINLNASVFRQIESGRV